MFASRSHEGEPSALKGTQHGISVWLVGLTPEVRTAVRRSPFGHAVGQERMFYNLDDAVAMHLATQGPV